MPADDTMTPVTAGFRMPPEWAPHARTWMAWPCRDALWHGAIGPARTAYAAVARAIAGFEPVTMLANPQHAAAAQSACGSGVEVMAQPLDDSWMRDIGPSFLLDAEGRLGGAAWRFNAWGRKWPDFRRDQDVAAAVLARTGARSFEAPFVMEGGSIHVDGEGTILTTEQCLLNRNRNPAMSRQAIEGALKSWLGGERVVWLPFGLDGDDTDGHVDNVACFARPGVVIAAVASRTADPNHRRLADNLERLRAERDASGRRFEIVELPLPAARMSPAGRMTLSYVNFYLANDAVIVPRFDDPLDRVARDRLARVFPEREIVPVPAIDILRGGGGIHCITQQQPASPPIAA